jgi:hypothetical protein
VNAVHRSTAKLNVQLMIVEPKRNRGDIAKAAA